MKFATGQIRNAARAWAMSGFAEDKYRECLAIVAPAEVREHRKRRGIPVALTPVSGSFVEKPGPKKQKRWRAKKPLATPGSAKLIEWLRANGPATIREMRGLGFVDSGFVPTLVRRLMVQRRLFDYGRVRVGTTLRPVCQYWVEEPATAPLALTRFVNLGLDLQPVKEDILRALLAAPDCALSFADLRIAVYGAKAKNARAIRVQVSALRHELDWAGLDIEIHTQRGFGYSLRGADVERAKAAA